MNANTKRYTDESSGPNSETDWGDQQSSRSRKKGSTKADKKEKRSRFPDLVGPLSKWAKERDLKPKDVHAFATRDIEKRITQAIKNGYIKRNLNVFFLYKRAYENIAQDWMTIHHPHLAKTQPPLVSLVGESWSKESDEFKKSFTIYSELEKKGLKAAFPDYKYKPGAKKEQSGVGVPTKDSPRSTEVELSKHNRNSPALDDYTQQDSQGFFSHWNQTHGPAEHLRDDVHHLPIRHEATLTSNPMPHGLDLIPMDHRHGPMIRGYGDVLLHQNYVGSHDFLRQRMTRSASPACSHHSQQLLDNIPIDPSLPDTYSDYLPSRATSEEPGFIAPSQAFTSAVSDIGYSRLPSAEPLFGASRESANIMTRGASEEPWQVTDSVLTSLPIGDSSAYNMASHEDHDWSLEIMEHDNHFQPVWDMNDWTHDFDDREFDRAG